MADPRLIAVTLDQASIGAAPAAIERERQVAVRDLLVRNHFRPLDRVAGAHDGPFTLTLAVSDGRLVLAIADGDARPLHQVVLGLARFRRPLRDYFAICDSYHAALASGAPARIEPIDMARRALHNEAADLLREALAAKVELDLHTARGLFTLLAALHLRG